MGMGGLALFFVVIICAQWTLTEKRMSPARIASYPYLGTPSTPNKPLTLAEAQKIALFDIVVPSSLPKGAIFDHAEVKAMPVVTLTQAGKNYKVPAQQAVALYYKIPSETDWLTVVETPKVTGMSTSAVIDWITATDKVSRFFAAMKTDRVKNNLAVRVSVGDQEILDEAANSLTALPKPKP